MQRKTLTWFDATRNGIIRYVSSDGFWYVTEGGRRDTERPWHLYHLVDVDRHFGDFPTAEQAQQRAQEILDTEYARDRALAEERGWDL